MNTVHPPSVETNTHRPPSNRPMRRPPSRMETTTTTTTSESSSWLPPLRSRCRSFWSRSCGRGGGGGGGERIANAERAMATTRRNTWGFLHRGRTICGSATTTTDATSNAGAETRMRNAKARTPFFLPAAMAASVPWMVLRHRRTFRRIRVFTEMTQRMTWRRSIIPSAARIVSMTHMSNISLVCHRRQPWEASIVPILVPWKSICNERALRRGSANYTRERMRMVQPPAMTTVSIRRDGYHHVLTMTMPSPPFIPRRSRDFTSSLHPALPFDINRH
mmetsp:Transcript_19485/g.38214  ORF Transcript_19485/g.38214 Transcript_19485/m.38214 type:complete len:277 (-) Transcript_19485:1095-1925(-)